MTLAQERWENLYATDSIPWDTGVVPPEVQTFWSGNLVAPVGAAIDLGCGTGTNVAFLASLGLDVVGFDLSYSALAVARRRLRRQIAHSQSRLQLVQADVSSLPAVGVNAQYILDIGCLHSIAQTRRAAYAACVVENLAPGGFYHLFAHTSPKGVEHGSEDDRGLEPAEVASLFVPALTLLTVLQGQPDPRPCYWYLLHKPI
jgi:cyclopropane fatty-acyl-phospholipid synthase-like methyltransferase